MTLLIAAILFAQTTQPASPLSSLPPLTKVHYSWLMNLGHADAVEYARIMGAVSISADQPSERLVRDALETAIRASELRGSPVNIALNYSVWHYKFRPHGADAARLAPVTSEGVEHVEELALLDRSLSDIARHLAVASCGVANPPQVEAILFDCEVFDLTGDAANDAAVIKKYNAAYDAAKRIFPNARIIWYGFYDHIPGDWEKTAYSGSKDFDVRVKNDGASVSLYYPGELDVQRELFRRTVDVASKAGLNRVVPWVSLGCGMSPVANTTARIKREWTWNYDYPLVFSWQMGRELNQPGFSGRPAFAPYDAADVVVLYPAPDDARVPDRMAHFVAYVRGATGLGGVR